MDSKPPIGPEGFRLKTKFEPVGVFSPSGIGATAPPSTKGVKVAAPIKVAVLRGVGVIVRVGVRVLVGVCVGVDVIVAVCVLVGTGLAKKSMAEHAWKSSIEIRIIIGLRIKDPCLDSICLLYCVGIGRWIVDY